MAEDSPRQRAAYTRDAPARPKLTPAQRRHRPEGGNVKPVRKPARRAPARLTLRQLETENRRLMRAITKARKHLERWQTACPGSDDENTAGSSALEVLYRAERRAARVLVAKRGGA